jgi:hypothetical protein
MKIYVVLTTEGVFKDVVGFELFKTQEEAVSFMRKYKQGYDEDEKHCFLYEREI